MKKTYFNLSQMLESSQLIYDFDMSLVKGSKLQEEETRFELAINKKKASSGSVSPAEGMRVPLISSPINIGALSLPTATYNLTSVSNFLSSINSDFIVLGICALALISGTLYFWFKNDGRDDDGDSDKGVKVSKSGIAPVSSLKELVPPAPVKMKKNLLMLIRPVLSNLSYYLKVLDIEFKAIFPIIAFIFFILICGELSPNVGLCMPGGSDRVNLALVEFYRPIVNQLPTESAWGYMFNHLEELKFVIETSSRGRLLGPEEAYEFIQQLYPVQLQSLLNSLLVSFRDLRPEIAGQFLLFSRDLLQDNTNCLVTLSNVAHDISLVRGIDISNQPLDESFLILLRELNFPREVERVYATHILLKTERLYAQYARMFTLFVIN